MKSNKKASSRRQIDIKGVQNGVLLLPGEQYRVVLEASAINFELKSGAEQDAIIETYQSFLNSLSTPVQILTRIREMDMQRYLDNFRTKLQDEDDQIYRDQIENYTEFVQSLIKTNKILARHFYIVVPFHNKGKAGFDIVQEQLTLNCDIVAKGLRRMGIRTRQLTSLEVLDLFYSFYNPAQAKRQPLTEQTLQLLKTSYL
jgi:hypothetical protein